MATPFHQPRAETRELALFGVRIRILLPAGAVPGVGFSVFEDTSDPGAGPPLHVHHDADEIFHVAEGHFRFWCDGAELEGTAGDTVVVPRGARHSFLNAGPGPGRLIVTMNPGGFERFFVELVEAGLRVPEDMGRIVETGARHGIEFLGPNPFATR